MKKMKNLLKNLTVVVFFLIGMLNLNAQVNDSAKDTTYTLKTGDVISDTLTYDITNIEDNTEFLNILIDKNNLDDSDDKDFILTGEKKSDTTMTYLFFIKSLSDDDKPKDIKINTQSDDDGNYAENNTGENDDYTYYAEFTISDTNKVTVDLEIDDNTSLRIVLNIATHTSINTFETNQTSIKLYPNPVINVLNIENENSFDETMVSIYDISGKKLIETTETRIDVSDLRNGIYVVNVAGKKYKMIKK